MNIPEAQNRPPAGFATELEYLPSCDDVQSRTVEKTAEFYVTRADGSEVILYRGTPNQFWQTWLGSAGLCKVGGESVPIVQPGHIVTLTQRPTVTNIPQQATPYPMILGVLGGLMLMGYLIYQSRPDAADQAFIKGGE